MSGLLVSVRSAAEARAALEGGADIIDVKEPSRGSLGRADDEVICEVLEVVAGRRPVSAALGEFAEHNGRLFPPGLSFVKWGLRGLGLARSWRRKLARACAWVRDTQPGCEPVVVAYADWPRVAGISPQAVLDFAWAHRLTVLLLDTCHKEGRTLVDLMTEPDLEDLCRRCRQAGIKIALAGSLTAAEILPLLRLRPDWFAVRGAVCRAGREAAVDTARVRELAQLLRT
jgi:uncharacterized protein (UPF0264 family)